MQIFYHPYTKSLRILTYDTLKYWTIFSFEKKNDEKTKTTTIKRTKSLLAFMVYMPFGWKWFTYKHENIWINHHYLLTITSHSVTWLACVRSCVRVYVCVCVWVPYTKYKREKSSSKCNAQNKSHIIKEKTWHCIKREYIKIKAKQKREINFGESGRKKTYTHTTNTVHFIHTHSTYINMYGGKCDAHSRNTRRARATNADADAFYRSHDTADHKVRRAPPQKLSIFNDNWIIYSVWSAIFLTTLKNNIYKGCVCLCGWF